MKFSRTDHVRNEEELLRVKQQRNIVHEISKRKANWKIIVLYILIFKFLDSNLEDRRFCTE
jgi:hypothetical protein